MLSLKDRNWKAFKLSLLGNITSGKDIYDKERIPGDTPYITSGTKNNGIGYFVSNTNETLDKKYISINRNGAVGEAFYHDYPSLLGNDCRKFKLINNGNRYVYLFIIVVISKQKECFNYSRKLGTARAKNMSIMLPINHNGEPDWQFMEDYVRERQDIQNKAQIEYLKNKLDSLGNKKAIPSAEDKNWESFRMSDLFSISKGNQNKMNLLIPGDIPLISAKNNNNGLKNFVSQNKTIFPSGTISLNCDGDGGVGLSYYQPADYMLDSHCKSLKANQKINEFSLIFISGCISKQRILFSHGRSINDNRAKTLKIMLPINQTRSPDYSYMEQYVKNLMIDKYTQYIKYLES